MTAVAVEGQSLQRTATQGHWTLAWVRAHIRPWIEVSVEFRMYFVKRKWLLFTFGDGGAGSRKPVLVIAAHRRMVSSQQSDSRSAVD